MRIVTVGLAALTLGVSVPAHADDAADIRALEERWARHS